MLALLALALTQSGSPRDTPNRKNTIHKMLIPENIARADADGGGTIDKKEFGSLLASSGVNSNSADMQATLLFAEADKDGDGELTLDELKRLVDYKAQNC